MDLRVIARLMVLAAAAALLFGCAVDRMRRAPETLDARCAREPSLPACRYQFGAWRLQP